MGPQQEGGSAMSVQRISTIFFDLGDTLVRSGVRAWVPGAKETLDALSAKSLRLGIISNTGDLNRDQLSALLPADFRFDAFENSLILLSSEVGVEKPSPEIFATAVSRANVEASKCLYCGENLDEALVAQAVGMRVARLLTPPISDIGRLTASLAASGLIAA
jgi:FMN phosphatase YigB (HAD superfamily)